MSLVEESREPLRPVVADDVTYRRCVQALADASGPIAFDVERAHGYRYWPKAYLLQIRRGGAGTWLIDPTMFTERQLGRLVEATGDEEWLIHAASQDLPSMAVAGIKPPRIFDTELAARLLGKPGVSLGALLSEELDIQLRKAHSAVNWATRPLKESWLHYAALDVDFLAELRDTLDDQLVAMGRRDWAEQEFAWELDAFSAPPPERVDPWRRVSRITSIKHPRGLAVAKALWEERDAVARRRDRPPTHILADQAIVDVGLATPREGSLDVEQLLSVHSLRKAPGSRYLTNWRKALESAAKLSPKQFPPKRPPAGDGVPHPRNWDRINPEAAARWSRVRPAIDDFACEIGIQPSLLAPPAPLQDVLWHHERPRERQLLDAGVRPWQASLLDGLLDELLG